MENKDCVFCREPLADYTSGCLEGKNLDDLEQYDMVIAGTNNGWGLFVDIVDSYYSGIYLENISYCPMCGRYLGELIPKEPQPKVYECIVTRGKMMKVCRDYSVSNVTDQVQELWNDGSYLTYVLAYTQKEAWELGQKKIEKYISEKESNRHTIVTNKA